MKRTNLIVPVAVIVIATAAFVVGRTTSDEEQDSTQIAAASTAESHGEQAEGHEGNGTAAPAVIEGVEHIHAVAHLPGGELLLGAHTGLYRSDDGGRSWSKRELSGEVESTDFMSLVPHPTEPGTLFAGGHGLGVVKSTDGGATWLRSDSGIDGSDIHALTINQRQPDYLFAYSSGRGVYRSTDGGSSWDRLDDGPENPGVRSFAYMAVQTDMDKSMGSDNWGLLFAGTADGIYDSYSCFCGWRETTDQFAGTTVYSLSTVQSDLRTMYAGTTDGLWKSTDEGSTWEAIDGVTGRIAAVAVDPGDPDEVIAVTESGQVLASRDAGRSWDERN